MIERSQDYRRIKKLTDHKLVVSFETFYLIVTASGVDVGLICFQPFYYGLIMHVEFAKGFGGKFAADAYLEGMEWVFENTTYPIIYGEIPEENKPACLMARKTGASFDGIEDGLRLYSIRKEAFQLEAA